MARSLDALAAGPPPLEEAVPPEASFVIAGGPAELAVARASLRERFADASTQLLPEALPPGARFAFALLDRALAFEPAFEPRDVMFAGEPVKGFAAAGGDPARTANVVVHDHLPGKSFVVELLPRGEVAPQGAAADRIVVLATFLPSPWGPPPPPEPRVSLAERVREALSRLDRLPRAEQAVAEDEAFSMPTLRIQELARFPELTSGPIPLAGGSELRIDEALQSVRFSLDETGARARSEAVLVAFGAPPRSLAVTGPFLVMLLRRGATIPYFAAWIETAGAMEKAPKPPGIPDGAWKIGPPTGSGGFGPFGGPPTF